MLLGQKKGIIYFGIITTGEKVFFIIGHLEVIIFFTTVTVNALFAYATHDFLLEKDASNLLKTVSSLGGIAYMITFALTSFSLFFEGKILLWSVIILFEMALSLTIIAIKFL